VSIQRDPNFTLLKTLAAIFILTASLTVRAAEDDSVATKTSHPKNLPAISVGQGLLNFYGDVGYSKLNQPLTARSGTQLEIQYPTNRSLSFSLFFLMGRLYGEEKNINRALNFRSKIMAGGGLIRFEFRNKRKTDQIITPFLTAGAEYLMFDSKTDLFDENGQFYNYWSDGSIRNIAETDPLADQATKIYRDYSYETDLRDANIDNVSDYPTATWAFPVGAGFKFRISDRISMDFGSSYHMTGTDLIDGISDLGSGTRKGNSKKDNFFFTNVSLRFNLSSPSRDDSYNDVDFQALAMEDSDGDGIPDIEDDSSGTPLNNMVHPDGKPFDTDNDGIPDYRDEEPNSAPDAVVTEKGVTITEEMIEEKFRKDSLAALPAVIEYLQSYDKLTQRNPAVEQRWIEKNSNEGKPAVVIPTIYNPIDTDMNGIITPKEISKAIDDYLARKSPYSVSEFFDLIDFFFSQN